MTCHKTTTSLFGHSLRLTTMGSAKFLSNTGACLLKSWKKSGGLRVVCGKLKTKTANNSSSRVILTPMSSYRGAGRRTVKLAGSSLLCMLCVICSWMVRLVYVQKSCKTSQYVIELHPTIEITSIFSSRDRCYPAAWTRY